MNGGTAVPGEKPILDWLLQQFPDTPKARAKQWIARGRVSVAGVIIRRPHQVIPDPGDRLTLQDRGAMALEPVGGWQIHPRVCLLHLDSSVGVINKGPGLISVPAPNCDLSALSILQDFLVGRLKVSWRKQSGRTVPPAWRRLVPFPVHRLDQYTSGAFCAGMNPEARQHLIEQLKTHTMTREYFAFAAGRSSVAQGTWRDWLQLSDDEMRQQVVSSSEGTAPRSSARQAVTHYQVVTEYQLPGNSGFITKLRLRLETGLKHQIRVQAAHAGLPLIGDRLYNPDYRLGAVGEPPIAFPRQALHAASLTLEHPALDGKRQTWTAPFPEDLRRLETTLNPKRI